MERNPLLLLMVVSLQLKILFVTINIRDQWVGRFEVISVL